MKKFSSLVALCLGAVGLAGSTGCMFPLNTQLGPSMNFPWPVPVSPYFQDKMETDHWNQERYARVPILGPITSGGVPSWISDEFEQFVFQPHCPAVMS